MIKICGSCKQEKDISEFYPHKRDGYQSICKDCERELGRIYNQTRRAYNYQKYKEWVDKGGLQEYRKRSEVKKRVQAGAIVQQAIRSGKIKRQPCIVCGNKAHAHHDNYNKPLDILWLCSKHHAEHHREFKAEGKQKELKKSG